MIRIEATTDHKQWDNTLKHFEPVSYLTSSAFWKLSEQENHPVHAAYMYNGTEVVSLALGYITHAKRGSFLTLSHCPLFSQSSYNEEYMKLWVEYFSTIAKNNKCVALKIAPPWESSALPQGFIRAPLHLHAEQTIIIDPTLSPEELLSQMRKSTRQMIKKSLSLVESGDLEYMWVDTIDSEMMNVYNMTTNRGGFTGVTAQTIQNEYTTFKSNEDAYIIKILNKGKLLSWGMFICAGKRAYYRHGANVLSREFPTPYLAYWKCFLKAKELGMISYDLWGVSPKHATSHPWKNVSLFKSGFGGTYRTLAHAIEKPLNWKYILLYTIDTVRAYNKGYKKLF